MYSVLAVDLDETLLDGESGVSARTMAALERWRDSGRRIVIATGRPPRSTRMIPPALHSYPWICYNGAWIEVEGRVLYETTIPVEDARGIVAAILAAAPDCLLGVEIADQLYTNREGKWTNFTLVSDVLAHTTGPTAKILTSLSDMDAAQDVPANGQVTARQSEIFLRGLPRSSRPLISPKYDLVQVMPRGASKAAALHWLLDRWGLSQEDVVAFGDDVNDVEMVAEAGLGVAMANAVPEVKAAADRITVSNEEDGVAVVLEEFLR